VISFPTKVLRLLSIRAALRILITFLLAATEKVSTEEQREALRTELSAAEDWLYVQEADAADKFTTKLKELSKLSDPIFFRLNELEKRPQALESVKTMTNYTRYSLLNSGSSST
jgi:hypothetical protein